MVTFGISSWSIHRSLTARSLDLFDVPAALRSHGMTDLHICHFHLPSQDDQYLGDLQQQIESNDITLDALLIDFGDLSHPEQSATDAREMERWLGVAAKLGARHARISAGAQTPTDEALARSAKRLLLLSKMGADQGVKVITENWHALMPGSQEVLRLIELTKGRVPLCLDFGNWTGEAKYAELAAIAPHAVTVHAKCGFSAEGVPEAADFTRCCEILRDAGYAGTVALIYDGPPTDEWHYLGVELDLARRVLQR